MLRLAIFHILVLLAVPTLLAQGTSASAHPDAIESSEVLGYGEAAILGAVEGFTEYLPISSTGHLILTNELLGLNRAQPVLNGNGEVVLQRDGSPMTVQNTADAYAIIIQVGAIAAVIIVYWRRLLDVLMGLLGKNRSGLLLGRNLLIAFLPAAVLGLLFNDWITAHLFGTAPVAIALFAGAFLILWAEWWRKRQPNGDGHDAHQGPDLHELSIRQCLFIGLMQSIAMWPGTSRSMMTIVAGYLAGLSAARAAEFSFLLGLITLSAAAGYTLLKHGNTLIHTLDPGPALLGIAVATLTAAIAVKWLVSYLSRHGLSIFAWYRLGLAIAVLLIL